MLDTRRFVALTGTPRLRVMLLTAVTLTCLAATAPVAGATMRIISHNDPAGDPTLIPYHFEKAFGGNPPDFSLRDGQEMDFGGPVGTYVAEARPPAGWTVANIDCVGPRPDFAVDLANGRVTINRVNHLTDEQTCAFTVRKAATAAGTPAPGAAPGTPAAPSTSQPSSGVAAAPPAQELPFVVLPPGPALVRVKGGLRAATATVRLSARSVVRATLLEPGGLVVGTARVVRPAGSQDVRVALSRRGRRLLARSGQKRATLTLRVVVVETGKAPRVFRFRVLVRT
ncbi:MAG: hypothetical protein QOF04_1999 [Solirubrobacteraceae bacterium]|nr:hypothetical protein [Solirubrobacteraceae bacterium]